MKTVRIPEVNLSEKSIQRFAKANGIKTVIATSENKEEGTTEIKGV